MKFVLVLILMISVGGVLLSIVGMIVQSIHNKSISKIKTSQLTIPKTKFIDMVNDWCYDNIKTNNPKPSTSVVYHKNKKMSGVYHSSNNSMVVYVNNTTYLIELVNIIIHEYTHSTQKNKEFDKLYNQYTQEKGYWDNPYEVECRKVSDKYQYECLRHLTSQYNIIN